jgi:hypothetical protein
LLEVVEDDGAVPTVAAARLGVDGASGATAEQLTVVVSVVHREEKGEGKKSGGARGGRGHEGRSFSHEGVRAWRWGRKKKARGREWAAGLG